MTTLFGRRIGRFDKTHRLLGILPIGDKISLPAACGNEIGDKIKTGRSTVAGCISARATQLSILVVGPFADLALYGEPVCQTARVVHLPGRIALGAAET